MSTDNEHTAENKIVNRSTVARILAEAINRSPKNQTQIAQEVGFERPNMVSMIKQGYTNLPIYKVKLVADCLGLDARDFLIAVCANIDPRNGK